jgi:hypothetical protein
MGFCNSPAYVQRQIDYELRKHREYTRVYIDDFIIFSDTLDDHITHLHAVFAGFERLNIVILPTKTYIGFPTVTLLGQYVDALGLSTTIEKLEAISKLEFPITLKDLETYIGMTGSLRRYVRNYAALIDPLQKRKTLLLRNGPCKGNPR